MYHQQSAKQKIDAIHAFYAAVSCKCADWALQTSFHLLKPLPLHDPNALQLEHIFLPQFENALAVFIESIEIYVGSLIRIL